jgi:putative oxygen-independent coproporphyrinogen III oxidase
MDADASFGLYVHVPFCRRRCDYCAFATWTDRIHVADDYVTACAGELRTTIARGLPEATSVFFGGGTPSLLSPQQLESILSAVSLAPRAEVTVECNPDTVDEAKLRSYADVGVTRLSFGVQSMASHVLSGLGREHDVESVECAVAAAALAGFASTYSVDLIFGGAGESLSDWEQSVTGVLALDPPPLHVSAYALTVEPGTPLASDRARHPDADDQAEKYMLAEQILGSAGLSWYEISNWASPGSECRHNQLYWAQGEYRGIGCAAHSHAVDTADGSARRWWNVRTPERYIGLIGRGESPEAAGELLDARARRFEALELSLRTARGVPEDALPGWQDDPVLADLVEPAADGRLALTLKGRLLANEVALRLD